MSHVKVKMPTWMHDTIWRKKLIKISLRHPFNYRILLRKWILSESSENPTTLVRTGNRGIIFTTASRAKKISQATKKSLWYGRIIYRVRIHKIIHDVRRQRATYKKSKGRKRMNFTFHVSFSPHPHIIFLLIHAASVMLKFPCTI